MNGLNAGCADLGLYKQFLDPSLAVEHVQIILIHFPKPKFFLGRIAQACGAFLILRACGVYH